MVGGRRPDVDGRGGDRTEALVDADDPLAEGTHLIAERVADVVVESPRRALVGVRLPRRDLVLGRGRGHRVERRRQLSDGRCGVALDEDVADTSELFDLAAGALHHLRRQRIGVGDDGDRGQHGDGGVAAAEDEVEPGVDPHARRRVVAARSLREPEPPTLVGAGLVLEEVGLDVDDELAPGEHGGGGRLLDRRLRRQRERAAGADRRVARPGAGWLGVTCSRSTRDPSAVRRATSCSRPPRCCTRRAPSTWPPSHSSSAGTRAATSPTAGRWCRRLRACAGSLR